MPTEKDPLPITTLTELRIYKERLSKEIHEDECKISTLWGNLFHKQEIPEPTTPVQRITNIMSMGTGVIDGLILGWKLYRKFKNSQILLKRAKYKTNSRLSN